MGLGSGVPEVICTGNVSRKSTRAVSMREHVQSAWCYLADFLDIGSMLLRREGVEFR